MIKKNQVKKTNEELMKQKAFEELINESLTEDDFYSEDYGDYLEDMLREEMF